MKRFDPIYRDDMGGTSYGQMKQCDDGDFVRFEDFQSELSSARAANAELLRDKERLEGFIDHMRRWLKSGATIRAIDTSRVLEWLPDGTMHGGLEIKGMEDIDAALHRALPQAGGKTT